MAPIKIVQKIAAENLTDKDGNKVVIKLKAGLTRKEITEFEQKLQNPIPDEIESLLTLTSGVEIEPLGNIDFSGANLFGLEDIFPNSVPILGDGEGNFWIIDIRQDTGLWGKIFLVCHDPPVIVIQSQNLSEFLTQILESFQPPYKNALAQIKEDAINRIVKSAPYLMDVKQARLSTDVVLSEFAWQLPDTFKVVDLRTAKSGAGFSYWESGKATKVQRCGAELIFGIDDRQKAGFFNRLLGKEK